MEKIKFIDLFAGIGGFRLGLERENFQCVASCEIDKHACDMYRINFHDNPYCDITKLNPNSLPDFDVLCAGFPCQAFSICGKQKGFADEARGTLFFDICRILKEKKPSVFILENVKNLTTHDKGRTMKIILNSLESLGYTVSYKVLNARNFGVPQNRERIVIIGSIEGKLFDFDKLETNTVSSMESFLDKNNRFEYLNESEYTLLDEYKKQSKSGLIFRGYLNKKIRKKGVKPNTMHLSRAHKQPNRIYSAEGTHPTISSMETSGRYWIHVDNKVRKLTIDECFRFFGFPENFKKIGAKGKLYQRIGNSVCVNMIQSIAKEVENQLFNGDTGMLHEDDPNLFLEKIYQESIQLNNVEKLLSKQQFEWINTIVKNEENNKGVFTVLLTSLTYKSLHPAQDVRFHQKNMEKGYSGRSFDTKYITPFLKKKGFNGAMKESGWLTRSLEQNLPYTLDFPGKINKKDVKNSFLEILNDIEVNDASSLNYLKVMLNLSITEKNKKIIELINPITPESECSINEIISYLKQHFYYNYKSRGASILPVIAIYSIYELLTKETARYNNKTLIPLESHHSSDKSSGFVGDINLFDDDGLYEAVEIKFDIPIDCLMVKDCYDKIKKTSIQRYYILSTKETIDKEEVSNLINKIKKEHGCQVITNGIFETINYYLRIIDNTDLFLNLYLKNLNEHPEINYEHKLSWNKIMTENKNN